MIFNFHSFRLQNCLRRRSKKTRRSIRSVLKMARELFELLQRQFLGRVLRATLLVGGDGNVLFEFWNRQCTSHKKRFDIGDGLGRFEAVVAVAAVAVVCHVVHVARHLGEGCDDVAGGDGHLDDAAVRPLEGAVLVHGGDLEDLLCAALLLGDRDEAAQLLRDERRGLRERERGRAPRRRREEMLQHLRALVAAAAHQFADGLVDAQDERALGRDARVDGDLLVVDHAPRVDEVRVDAGAQLQHRVAQALHCVAHRHEAEDDLDALPPRLAELRRVAAAFAHIECC
jgi:hypothetical protein